MSFDITKHECHINSVPVSSDCMSVNNYKWIVHPHSYKEKGSREISVIHESFTHGLESYGWFNVDKKLIALDSVYGNIEDGAFNLLINYAKDIANQLNNDNVQPNEDVLKETKKRNESMIRIGKECGAKFHDKMVELFGEVK